MAKTQAQKSPTITADYPNLGSYSDPTTAGGKSQFVQVTVQEYLRRLNLWDGTTVSDLGPNVGVHCQRGVLGINGNKIKQKMLRHVLRGGVLPPLVVYDNGKFWQVLDGLQRTDVIVESLRTIKLREEGPEASIKKFAKEQIEKIESAGYKHLTSDIFLELPVAMQVWSELNTKEIDELFIILNKDQQKVSPQHILEVDQLELKKIFIDWGIPVTTMREGKEHPLHGRRPKDEVISETKRFKFNNLLNGLKAYNEHDQHILTSGTIHEESTIDIGKEHCEMDFKWVCITLNNIIRAKYGARKGYNILYDEVFFVPLMAAIGKAREDAITMSFVESRQSELIDLLKASTSEDPLVLEGMANESNDPLIAKHNTRALRNIFITIRSSVGKKKRDMIYKAWKEYFRIGAPNPDYPLDWQEGAKS
jgi:hypothetical protein